VLADFEQQFNPALAINLSRVTDASTVSGQLKKRHNTLKNKGLIITTIAFFLLVNTTYFWEGRLGILAFPAFIILVAVYVGLLFGLFIQIYFAIREKFNDRQRIVVLTIITLVLILTFFRPFGLIDFDRLQGADLLVASREGGGNCKTTFKLKENNRFVERSVCFGVTEIKGTYKLKNDTIYFENVDRGRQKNEYHKFAVIKQSKYSSDKKVVDFVRYTNSNDTIEYELFITKNELDKLTNKKPTR
jgi:hypothetical protein